MKNLINLNIEIAYREPQYRSYTPLFSATNFSIESIVDRLNSIPSDVLNCEIQVSKLSFNGVHLERIKSIVSVGELKELLNGINEYVKKCLSNDIGDSLCLYRVIGALDNSDNDLTTVLREVDQIVSHTYKVDSNFIDGIDIRKKDKLFYIEVGKGVLIGIEKKVT